MEKISIKQNMTAMNLPQTKLCLDTSVGKHGHTRSVPSVVKLIWKSFRGRAWIDVPPKELLRASE